VSLRDVARFLFWAIAIAAKHFFLKEVKYLTRIESVRQVLPWSRLNETD
jgi:hypothetical protein